MYGPSPIAFLLLMAWTFAAILNLFGINYASKITDERQRLVWTLLNATLPGLLVLGFMLISLGFFAPPP
jgi:hypothetical protein